MGAKTWPCYNENHVITSSVVKRLKCKTIQVQDHLRMQ